MHDHERPRAQLTKSLGLTQLSLYGIGTIIGAGIYAVIGPAAAAAGHSVWISFFLAAVISALSALSYAEIASALPGAGGEHHFLRRTFPKTPVLAFIVGLFISIHSAAVLATVALTFGFYFENITGISPGLTALALMAVMTAMNIRGIGGASRLYTVLTVFQIACLLVLAFYSLSATGGGERLAAAITTPPESWFGVFQATAIVFFVYTGYEHMASMSEEARNPGRDIWRAFILALLVTSAVYGLIVFGVLAAVPAGELARSSAPLALAASSHSAFLGDIILAAALVATANAVLSASLSGSRMLFGMARDGDLPAFLGKTTGEARSPAAAAFVFLAVAAGFVALGRIDLAASLSSLGALLVFVLVNTAVIVLRYTQPDLKRPFRLVSIGRFPITAAAGIATSLVIAAQFEPLVYLIFAFAAVLGAIAYMFARRGQS